MTNDIKEINIPENVLVALGDLTNGALNYYKATETVNVRHNTILNYITNLQEEKQEMKNGWQEEIYEKDKVLSDWLEDERKINILQQRIDKAVEYIDSFCLEEDGYVGYGDDLTPKELINILRGDE